MQHTRSSMTVPVATIVCTMIAGSTRTSRVRLCVDGAAGLSLLTLQRTGVFLWDRMFGTLVDEADAWEHPADPSIKANGGWVEEYETFGIMQEVCDCVLLLLQGYADLHADRELAGTRCNDLPSGCHVTHTAA